MISWPWHGGMRRASACGCKYSKTGTERGHEVSNPDACMKFGQMTAIVFFMDNRGQLNMVPQAYMTVQDALQIRQLSVAQ